MGIQERRERERQARRDLVLDAARSLLLERGFNGTTTKQIAERCELSEATLFFYFQSKDEILVSLLFEGIEFTARRLQEIADAGLAPEERLAALWRFFSEIRAEHPEYFLMFGYLARPQSTATVTAETRAEIAHRSGDNFRLLAEVIAGAAGGRDSRLLADLMWSAFVGLMALRDTRTNLEAPPHPTDAELARAFELLHTGLASAQGDGS
jgi:AcrR family transcriptional regulator